MRRYEASLLAAAIAAVWLLTAPPSTDLAAHVFRSDLFERAGFTLWNPQWYGGHFTPSYSLLFPPLAAVVSPELVGALAAVAATACFARLLDGWIGEAGRLAAPWFAIGATASLFSGRLPFALGVALAVAAALAAQRDRRRSAITLAVLCSAASPVAGLFLALAGAAWALAGPRRPGAELSVAAVAPVLILSLLFPEDGIQPFATPALALALVAPLALAALVPREQRALRIGTGLYAALLVLAFALDTPMGSNAVRLGALLAGPLAAALLWQRRPGTLALLALPLLYLQVHPAVRDVVVAGGDPATRAAYHRPLVDFLSREAGGRPDPPWRVEIAFTNTHWEAAHVADRFALARGWLRQLDVARNDLFYDGELTAARYADWLRESGVRFVALPDADLDNSARDEARLLRSGLPFLRERPRLEHWRVWEFTGFEGLAGRGGRVTAMGSRGIDLVPRRGRTIRVAARWSRYLTVEGDDGACVREGRDGATVVEGATRPLRLVHKLGLRNDDRC